MHQTLHTARLTSNPQPPPPPRNPTTSTSFLTQDVPSRPPPKAPPGILRHRLQPTEAVKEEIQDPADPKTVELISRFLNSQGVRTEMIGGKSFRELIMYLNPKAIIPKIETIRKHNEKQMKTIGPLVNFQKTIGPLSVTIDVAGEDVKFLVFSIHYFEDQFERKNVVYLRKLAVSELDPEGILTSIRRSVNPTNYLNVKFTNMVVPNDEVYDLIRPSTVTRRYFICFYNYMSRFVAELFEITEFSAGLTQLREFVRFIKHSPEVYTKFRRYQLSKNGEVTLPDIDDGPWQNTAYFLTRCLVLHDSFYEFARLHRLFPTYINQDTLLHMIFLQRLLHECVTSSIDLSTPTSSISQIIPTINRLHSFVDGCIHGLKDQILRLIRVTFMDILEGEKRDRYHLATILDPRFAYDDEVFPQEIWTQWEREAIQEFMKLDPTMLQSFKSELLSMDRASRVELLKDEFLIYRTLSQTERPESFESPNYWWGKRQSQLECLNVLAREFLAPPAVTLDASYFFQDSGKFEYICHMDPLFPLELAGQYQTFRGRGATDRKVTKEAMDVLKAMSGRYQRQMMYGGIRENYALPPVAIPVLVPEEKNEEMMEEQMIDDAEDTSDIDDKPDLGPPQAPNLQPIVSNPPRPLHRHPTFKGQRVMAVPIRQFPLQPRVIAPVIRRPVAPPPQNLAQVLAQTEVVAQAQAQGSLDREIKEEIVDPEDLIEVKEEPMDDYGELLEPKVEPGLEPRPRPSLGVTRSPCVPPPTPWNRNNNGQKVFRPRAFVPLPPLPRPISIRAPIPGASQNQPMFKLPRIPEEKSQTLEEFGMMSPPGRMYNEALAMSEHAGIHYKAQKAPDYSLHPQPRKPGNRRCSVCNLMFAGDKLKNVTIDSEKLLVMVGRVYRNEYSLAEAAAFLAKETKVYVCHTHLAETVDEIYKMFHLRPTDDVTSMDHEKIGDVMLTVTTLRRHVTPIQLYKFLCDFVERNRHLKETLEDYSPSDEFDAFNRRHDHSASTSDDFYEEQILPKVFRQPRKQVLDDDHDATVKVIEQENFRLPTAPNDDENDVTNPGLCCFCSKRGDRAKMLKVPRSEDRLSRWVEKLGPKFEERISREAENWICRSHFPEEAFSSRGRLLRGMIPDSDPEKVEVTYRIKGDDFLKLKTQKTGTMAKKRATIDLAWRGHSGSPEEEDLEPEEELEEPEEEDLLEEEEEEHIPTPKRPTPKKTTPKPRPPLKRKVGRPKGLKKGWVYEETTNDPMEEMIIKEEEPEDEDYCPARKRGRPKKYLD